MMNRSDGAKSIGPLVYMYVRDSGAKTNYILSSTDTDTKKIILGLEFNTDIYPIVSLLR